MRTIQGLNIVRMSDGHYQEDSCIVVEYSERKIIFSEQKKNFSERNKNYSESIS